MGRHVLGSLNGDLQRVLDESLLADVGVDHLGSRESPKLRDAGLDEGELLGQ